MEPIMDGAAPSSAANSTASEKAGRLKALVARKRAEHKVVKQVQQEQKAVEEKSTETWSGLRITNRCVRQEKWDLSMQGKAVLPLSTLSGPDPLGRDQVIIGVLSSSVLGPHRTPDGKESAHWTLTDLDANQPQQLSLVLTGRAMEHWSRKDGLGRPQAVAGSIMAVLNPSLTGRSKTVRITFESQLLKLGTCPSFGFCTAKNRDGLECREPYNKDAGVDYCASHASMSMAARQNHRTPQHSSQTGTSQATGYRPVPTPISSSTALVPSGAGLVILERAHVALDALGQARTGAILQILQDLEAAQLDGVTLGHSKLYEKIGSLAQVEDSVGAAAKSLRRKWRILMDNAGRSSSEGVLWGESQPVAKKPRLG